jgi:CheY-like chemotaxis protein
MTEKAPKKILIVDDEKDVLTYLSNILRRADYQVISAEKGTEAIDLAIHELPDLIILDIVLPGDMDGGDVASVLSENPSTCDMPIIFLTALMRKDEEKKLGRSGRRYMMAKPVAQEELLKTINKALIG